VRQPSLSEIAQQRVITLSRASETRRMIDGVFAANGCVLEHIIEVANCRSAMEFVGLGLGFGLVHGICAGTENLSKVRTLQLAPQFSQLQVGLIARRESLFEPAHSAFIDALCAEPVT
jgi:DNA-binding transcriptional LysR family regulator